MRRTHYYSLLQLLILAIVCFAQPSLRKREDLAGVCQSRRYEVGVEVGVQMALFSEQILSHWKSAKRYYLVDMWRSQSNYSDGANVADDEQEKRYQIAQRRMARFGSKAVFIRNDSLSALHLVPDNSVDFVYIDARHDYCGAFEDLVAWWPKLRKGGLFAGHDYFTNAEFIEHMGAYRPKDSGDDWSLCGNGTRHQGAVKGAVLDFARTVNVSAECVSNTGSVKHAFPSWYFPFKS